MPSKDTFPLRANRARMRREFNAQARIGKYGKTGLDRVAFTPAYNDVRDLVQGWMKEAGLETRVDAVGNLYGRKEGRMRGLPAVMVGSHLDSQSPGGRFDGPAGVLTALEAVRRIDEAGFTHAHPIEVVAFVGEESACGMTVFGSSVATGVVGVKDLKNTAHPPTGKSLYEAIEAVGGNPARVRSCRIQKGSLKAFLELHIEQGPVLESADVPIGIVDRVVGYTRGDIHFSGVAAHSGGQPMPYRKDAGMAAADFMVRVESIVNRAPESQRLTITFGEMEALPGMGVHRARRRAAFLRPEEQKPGGDGAHPGAHGKNARRHREGARRSGPLVRREQAGRLPHVRQDSKGSPARLRGNGTRLARAIERGGARRLPHGGDMPDGHGVHSLGGRALAHAGGVHAL